MYYLPVTAQKKYSRVNNSVGHLVFLVLVILHLWVIFRFSVNVPFLDDYAFVSNIISLKNSPLSITELVNILLTPHGPNLEHLLVFARLSAVIDYFVEGELNFRTLFFIGNFILILTVLLLLYISRKATLSFIQFLPVAFLVFQPQYYENTTTWAICALQHIPSLFLAFLTFYLLTRQSVLLFTLTLPIALLGTLSNGNGIAILITGFFLLLVNKKYTRLIIWLIFSFIVFNLFYKFTHLHNLPDEFSNITHPLRILGGFFLMNGSMGILFTPSLTILTVFGILISLFLALIVGIIISYLTGYTRWFNYISPFFNKIFNVRAVLADKSAVLSLIGCYIYLIISILGIAYTRSTGWHYCLLVPRYIWFTTVLVSIGYLLTILILKSPYRTRFNNLVLILSLLFCFYSYRINMDEISNIRKSQLSDLHNWREAKLLISMPPTNRGYDTPYSDLLGDAIKQGIYRLPNSNFDSILHNLRTLNIKIIEKDSIFRQGQRQHERLVISKSILPPPTPFTDGAYLLLKSTQHTFVWPINQSIQKTAHLLTNGGPYIYGNVATIFRDILPTASYRVGIIYKRDEKWHGFYSSYLINVGPHSPDFD